VVYTSLCLPVPHPAVYTLLYTLWYTSYDTFREKGRYKEASQTLREKGENSAQSAPLSSILWDNEAHSALPAPVVH